MKRKLLSTIALTCFAYLPFIEAQVAITNVNQTYNQNFTSLTPVNAPWVNNSSLEGWYLVQETNDVNALLVNDGSISIKNVYNFGLNGDPDRSLGALAAANRTAFIGLHFTNSTDFTIDQINLSYLGKQWRRGVMAGAQTLEFFFREGGSDFVADTNNAGWTAQPAFDFVSPQTDPFPNVLNGNNPTNQTAISNALTGLSIAPGEQFWFRWFLPGPIEFGHGLAIDDVNITFSGFTNVINPGPTNNNTNSLVLTDVQLSLKKPKTNKTLRFKGANGFAIKGLILATTSVVTKASYAAFATSTNIPTNLVFLDAGKFKTKIKKKLSKKGVVALFKQKGKANKAGIGIAPGTPAVTLIVKIDGLQGTNIGTALFTNDFTSKVK